MFDKNQYNYIPNINPFMEQAGYKMDIFDILNEQETTQMLPDYTHSKNKFQAIEFIYYTPSDINGL